MVTINRIEFYITNVCNYNCSNCNRLNNYQFSGHQYWEDYKDTYTQWSKKVNFNKIRILGGEPFLNPTLFNWVQGIRELWPNAVIELLTNGTRLEFANNWYEYLKQYNVNLSIQLHNRSHYNGMLAYIESVLDGPIQYIYGANSSAWVDAYNTVKDVSWPDCESWHDFNSLPDFIKDECTDVHHIDIDTFKKEAGSVMLTDDNGINVTIQHSEHFVDAPLRYSGNNQFNVYNSDPQVAHKNCISKTCHHFVKGKLYKCHHVALLPEFLEQYHVNISDSDIKLLNLYQPALVTDSDEGLNKFVKNLPAVIPQCKLCPENPQLEERIVAASTQKIKIEKIQKKVTPQNP
jgi:organic radical activating enzyme